MSDLISRKALLDSLYSCEELKGRKTTEAVAKTIMEQPTVEAIPKSYVDQIRWERDIAIEQLNEIGCQFGQKMDEVKKKLGASQWILCSERLPEGCEDAELEVLVCTKEKYIEAEFDEAGFALYYPGEKKFRSVYNHSADITENVIAWMELPEPYKGEQHETD